MNRLLTMFCTVLILSVPPAAFPQVGVIDRVSVASDGTEGNIDSLIPSRRGPAVPSPDGRFVAFESGANNLVAGDTNGVPDVFVRDTCLGAPPACTPATVRVSVASDGAQGDGQSDTVSLSPDGRFVVFDSDATDLVPADTNGVRDIFIHDRDADDDGVFDEPGAIATVRVSVAGDGTEGNDSSFEPFVSVAALRQQAISADGRFVAFASDASNLVAGDTNLATDVFLHDRDADEDGVFDEPGAIAMVRVSVASDGTQADAVIFGSLRPSISVNGRFVAFVSDADNLVAGDTNSHPDIFLRDTCLGSPPGCAPSTERISVSSDGTQSNEFSFSPTMSADGRFVSFHSGANNLVTGDSNGFLSDVFVRDTCMGAGSGCTPSTALVSLNDSIQSNADSRLSTISADGRIVVFESDASNLAPADTNSARDIFVRDTCVGAPAGCTPSTIRASVASDGSQGEVESVASAISADGLFVAFYSLASNLVANDTNGSWDVFLASSSFPVTNFVFAVSPASANVTAGQSASFTVTVSPKSGAFDDTVSLSCSNLPSLSSCSFSPGSLTPGASDATSSLTVSTTAPSAFLVPPLDLRDDDPLYALWLGMPGVVLAGLALVAFAPKKNGRFWMLVCVLISLLAIQVACGGGSGGGPSVAPPPMPGTPAGSFDIIITGTSGPLQHSTTATLVVQ